MTDLRYDVIEDNVPPGRDPMTVISWLTVGLTVALVGLGAAAHHDVTEESTTSGASQQLSSTYRYHDLVPVATRTTVQLSPSYAFHDLVPARE